MNFFKIIFSWWNSQTLGTFLFTLFKGKKVGTDEFGNTYFQNNYDTKRWVIYKDLADASKIPPEWHSWLHKMIKTTPDKINFNNFDWQKKHKENLTGTSKAYLPKNNKKMPYSRWQPK